MCTPRDLVIAEEDRAAGDEDDAAIFREEVINQLMGYLFASGLDPGEVMRRLYAVIWERQREKLMGLRPREVALVFGDGADAREWRLQQVFHRLNGALGAHRAQMQSVLQAVGRRMQEAGDEWEQVYTPLSDVLAPDGEAQWEQDLRGRTIDVFLGHVCGGRLEAGSAVRRLFAITWATWPAVLGYMTQEEISALFAETPAAQSWRIYQVFSNVLKEAGARGYKAPGQKAELGREIYRESQRGNENRRGGRRTQTHPEPAQ